MADSCLRRETLLSEPTWIAFHQCDNGNIVRLRLIQQEGSTPWLLRLDDNTEFPCDAGSSTDLTDIDFTGITIPECCADASIHISSTNQDCCDSGSGGSGSGGDCDDGTCRFAIYVGNENGITDDDFALFLNGVQIATLPELQPDPCSRIGPCRGYLVLPTSMVAISDVEVTGRLFACAGIQFHPVIQYSGALDNPPASNEVRLVSTKDNDCGNLGAFTIYRVCVQNGDLVMTPVLEKGYGGATNQYEFQGCSGGGGTCSPCSGNWPDDICLTFNGTATDIPGIPPAACAEVTGSWNLHAYFHTTQSCFWQGAGPLQRDGPTTLRVEYMQDGTGRYRVAWYRGGTSGQLIMASSPFEWDCATAKTVSVNSGAACNTWPTMTLTRGLCSTVSAEGCCPIALGTAIKKVCLTIPSGLRNVGCTNCPSLHGTFALDDVTPGTGNCEWHGDGPSLCGVPVRFEVLYQGTSTLGVSSTTQQMVFLSVLGSGTIGGVLAEYQTLAPVDSDCTDAITLQLVAHNSAACTNWPSQVTVQGKTSASDNC